MAAFGAETPLGGGPCDGVQGWLWVWCLVRDGACCARCPRAPSCLAARGALSLSLYIHNVLSPTSLCSGERGKGVGRESGVWCWHGRGHGASAVSFPQVEAGWGYGDC